MNNDFWVTSDEFTSEDYLQIASLVTQKSLFTVTNVLFYLLHAILLETIIDRQFRHCR